MLTLDSKFEKFFTAFDGKVEGMQTAADNLSKGINILGTATTSSISGIKNCYNTKNTESLLAKLTNLNNVISDVDNSLKSDLGGVLGDISSLLGVIGNLKEDIEKYNDAEGKANAERNKEDANLLSVSYYDGLKTSAYGNYSLHDNQASRLYRKIMNTSAGVRFSKKYANTEYLYHLDLLQYGHIEEDLTYTASNGEVIHYSLYVPDYGGVEVDGLPIHVYMHGAGETGTRLFNIGLPKLIKDKEVTPEGVVVMLQAKTTNDFYRKTYRDGVIELVDKSIEEYHCNPNRQSVSGHSMGAIAGYRLIADNPNRFSAFVPISGLQYIGEELVKSKKTKLYLFHGEWDNSCPYGNAVQTINYLNEHGMEARLHTFQRMGHGDVQNKTFQEKFDDWGEETEILKWCSDQELDN